MTSKSVGRKVGLVSALVLAAGVSGYATYRGCDPMVETRTERVPVPQRVEVPGPERIVTQTAPAPAAPVKGDLRCEVQKGEAWRHSPNYDEVSCGRCGDNIRQTKVQPDPTTHQLPATGSAPREENGVRVQDVTERDSETPETCPVDFLCGNNKIDRLTFAAELPIYAENGTTVVGYRVDTLEINECDKDSPFHCAADCPERSGRRAETSTTPVIAPQPRVTTPQEIPDCPPSIATSAGDLQSAIGRALTRNSPTMRPLLGASAEQAMTFRFTFVAAPNGSLTFRSDSATIAGSAYQGGADIWSALGLNASNYSVGETNLQYPCKFALPGRIQAEGQ